MFIKEKTALLLTLATILLVGQSVIGVSLAQDNKSGDSLVVQGYAVDENLGALPANLVKIEIKKQGIQEGIVSENNNPYFFRDLSVTNYTVKMNIPSGYDLMGYTMCYDRTDCHNEKPKAGSMVGVQSSRSTKVVDLWWHLKKKNSDNSPYMKIDNLLVEPTPVIANQNFKISAKIEITNSNFSWCNLEYRKEGENDWKSPYGGYKDICTNNPVFEFQLPEGNYRVRFKVANDKVKAEEIETKVEVKNSSNSIVGLTVQGYAVDENLGALPANLVKVEIKKQGSGDGAVSENNNPYFFKDFSIANYTAKISMPKFVYPGDGYDFVGYTLCYDRTDCHNQKPKTGSEVKISPTKSTKIVDLWWHFKKKGNDAEKYKFAISESLRDYNTGAFISDMASTFEISCTDGFKQTANFAAGVQRIRDVIESDGKCTVKFDGSNTNYVYKGYRKTTCLNSCGSDDKSGTSQKLNTSKSVSLNAKVDGTQEYIIDWYLEKKTNTVACVKEGQSITYGGGDTGKRCCDGLTEIDPKILPTKCKSELEKCTTGTWKKICTAKCGNGICDKNTESVNNCSSDCGSDALEKISYKLIGDVRDANNIKKTINKKMLKMKLVCGDKEYTLKKGNQDIYSSFNFKINQNLGQQCTLVNMGGMSGYRYRGYTICENEDIPSCHANQDMVESSNIDMGALDIDNKDKIQVRWYFEKLE